MTRDQQTTATQDNPCRTCGGCGFHAIFVDGERVPGWQDCADCEDTGQASSGSTGEVTR